MAWEERLCVGWVCGDLVLNDINQPLSGMTKIRTIGTVVKPCNGGGE